MSAPQPRAARSGFSLVEVMVALVVISVGLLGIAKMQALALSSTNTARMRSIAALEAASLASMIHANQNYWSAFTTSSALSITVSAQNSNFTSNDTTNLVAPSTNKCTAAAPCSAAQLAAVDLNGWATALNQTMPPNTTGTISCNTPSATAPVTCSIQLSWTENVIALNTGANASVAASVNSSALQATAPTHYILLVTP